MAPEKSKKPLQEWRDGLRRLIRESFVARLCIDKLIATMMLQSAACFKDGLLG
jgi:hypothetical protein